MLRLKSLLIGCVVLMTVFVGCTQPQPQPQAAAAPDPEKPGPYPVGVTTQLFVDHSRTDAATNGPRSLMTEIWYPATDDTKDLPKNHLLDFFVQNQSPEFAMIFQMAFGVDILTADKTFKNMAVRDARVRDGVYPLLLFSHGNGGFRMQNAFWCEHMASHGYIVMAPDHTGNCAVTFIDGNMVIFNDNKEARTQSSADRPKDLSFLIDTAGRMNKGGDSRFRAKIDLEKIGAAGHSFGGYTCTWLVNQEPRIKAIAPMAGVAPDQPPCPIPLMLLIASEDDTLGAEKVPLIRAYYDAAKGPKYSIEFKNAGHYSFTEMYQLKPTFGDGVGEGKRITNGEPIKYIPMDTAFTLTNGYTTAFFGKYIKGITGYEPYLAANRNPDELITKAAP